MIRKAAELPDALALLPDTTAAKYLTRSVRTGQEEPPRVALLRASTPVEEHSARWATYPVRELVDEAMRRFGDDARARADAWLAPRLHATIRMTRAEASDTGLWNFLALVVAPGYVVWRHLGKGRKGTADGEAAEVAARRFSGRHDTQTFARLWWARNSSGTATTTDRPRSPAATRMYSTPCCGWTSWTTDRRRERWFVYWSAARCGPAVR